MKVQRDIKEVTTIKLFALIIGDFFEFEGNLHILLQDDGRYAYRCLRLNDNTLVSINREHYVIPIDDDNISITFRR